MRFFFAQWGDGLATGQRAEGPLQQVLAINSHGNGSTAGCSTEPSTICFQAINGNINGSMAQRNFHLFFATLFVYNGGGDAGQQPEGVSILRFMCPVSQSPAPWARGCRCPFPRWDTTKLNKNHESQKRFFLRIFFQCASSLYLVSTQNWKNVCTSMFTISHF